MNAQSTIRGNSALLAICALTLICMSGCRCAVGVGFGVGVQKPVQPAQVAPAPKEAKSTTAGDCNTPCAKQDPTQPAPTTPKN